VTAPADVGLATSAAATALQGLSHLALTVRDVDAAERFWCDVMGFGVMVQGDGFCMVIHRAARVAIGLTDHRTASRDVDEAGSFNERRVGLDHLALAVADLPSLQAWAARLAARGVPHSPIAVTEAGYHLNLRAPDDLPIELFVMDPAWAAAFRIDAPSEAFARGH
jgi:glyoxylase I family protein